MKKLLTILIISIMSTGCLSGAVKEKLSLNAAKLDGYVKKMEEGETTPKQDQDLIRAMRIWTWQMNRTVNNETPPPDVLLIIAEGQK